MLKFGGPTYKEDGVIFKKNVGRHQKMLIFHTMYIWL